MIPSCPWCSSEELMLTSTPKYEKTCHGEMRVEYWTCINCGHEIRETWKLVERKDK